MPLTENPPQTYWMTSRTPTEPGYYWFYLSPTFYTRRKIKITISEDGLIFQYLDENNEPWGAMWNITDSLSQTLWKKIDE